MKAALIFTIAIWSTLCHSQLAEEGSYVLVRSAVKGCERWTSRILDVVRVEDKETVTLMAVPNVVVKQLDHNQIKANLLAAIQDLTDNQPESFEVEILESYQQYRLIVKEYISSSNRRVSGTCPFWYEQRHHWHIEEQIEKIRRRDIARSMV